MLLDGNALRFDGASPLLSQTVANTGFNISNNVRLQTDTTFRATNGGILNVGVAVGGQVDLNRNNLTLDVGANSTIALGRVGVTTFIGDVEGRGLITITGANDTDARVILTGNALHADGVNLQSGRLLVGSDQALGSRPAHGQRPRGGEPGQRVPHERRPHERDHPGQGPFDRLPDRELADQRPGPR